MTDTPTKDRIKKELQRIKGPNGESSVVALGLVSEMVVTSAGKVYFAIAVPPERAEELEPLRQAAEIVVSELDGVGKSATAVNLALGFAANGLKVGILDADIYGPSIPRLLGLNGRPDVDHNNILRPMDAFGLKAMSMGFLITEDEPMIWRGPMVTQALTQMLRDVAWGELDVLVVDMAPGTDDSHLTMAQQVPIAGPVIICTPQHLALLDARRASTCSGKRMCRCLALSRT